MYDNALPHISTFQGYLRQNNIISKRNEIRQLTVIARNLNIAAEYRNSACP